MDAIPTGPTWKVQRAAEAPAELAPTRIETAMSCLEASIGAALAGATPPRCSPPQSPHTLRP